MALPRVVGGIPTRPDVEALMHAFPNLKPGDEIAYEHIERVIHAEKGSARFNTVVHAWRRKILEAQNRKLKAIPSVGFLVLNEVQRLDEDMRQFGNSARQIRRTTADVAMIRREELSAPECARLDTARSAMVETIGHVRAGQKRIAELSATPSLPRILPPSRERKQD